MENKKLSKEELDNLKKIQSDSSNLIFNLGQVDMQRSLLEAQRDEILNKLADLQGEQNTLARELQDKYGEGNINLETGEFIVEEK
jgi:uncharacterized protein (DUF3084 family)